MNFLTYEQGKRLVRIARNSVTSCFEGKIFNNEDFKEKKGVFVSIHNYSNLRLMGCIGFIEPIYGLSDAVIKAAKAAAFQDSRFKSVIEGDLNKIVFEVSVLTTPRLVTDIKKIKIGREGLIVEKGNHKGLLLPQVAVQYGFSVIEFLEQTSIKAGLDKDGWKDAKVYMFQAQIFKEVKPMGDIVEE